MCYETIHFSTLSVRNGEVFSLVSVIIMGNNPLFPIKEQIIIIWLYPLQFFTSK